jgi:hypothetical protein
MVTDTTMTSHWAANMDAVERLPCKRCGAPRYGVAQLVACALVMLVRDDVDATYVHSTLQTSRNTNDVCVCKPHTHAMKPANPLRHLAHHDSTRILARS